MVMTIKEKVRIIVGGQFGSEGKGAVVQYLVDQTNNAPMVVIRTGGPNAGHSMKHEGKVYKMRQLPCGWHNPNAHLMLGPGSIIDEDVLSDEIKMVESVTRSSLVGRLHIDANATIIGSQDKDLELDLKKRIGSTGKGIGAATAAKVMRQAAIVEGGGGEWLAKYTCHAPKLLDDFYERGYPIIVESSQGFGLSLNRSGYYPFATSRDLTPCQIMNDAGIPHNWPNEVISVFRTYPIRVAGNSGGMGAPEISWDVLKERTQGYVQEERTTVTNLVRRVSEWSTILAQESCFAVQPDWCVLTFYDYMYPELANRVRLFESEMVGLMKFQQDLSAPVRWVGTGFGSIVELTEKQMKRVMEGTIA